MSDVAIIATKVDRLQVEVTKLSEVISRMAVQEEKINALALTVAKVEAEHDKCRASCQIHTVVADINWIKWFVMGNSVAILGMVIGVVGHYMRAGGA